MAWDEWNPREPLASTAQSVATAWCRQAHVDAPETCEFSGPTQARGSDGPWGGLGPGSGLVSPPSGSSPLPPPQCEKQQPGPGLWDAGCGSNRVD